LRRRRRKIGFMGLTPEQRRTRCPPWSRPRGRKDNFIIPARVIYKGILVYFMLYTIVLVGKGSIKSIQKKTKKLFRFGDTKK
jgi:hypothetical protein